MDRREEQMEVFGIFDTKGDGKIEANQLGSVLRALGQNPTESMLRKYMNPADQLDGQRRISYEEFLPIYNEIAKQPLDLRRDDIVSGFRAFDVEQSGVVQSATLRNLLSNLGDRLSTEEVDQLLQGFENDDGTIDYEKFTDAILNEKGVY